MRSRNKNNDSLAIAGRCTFLTNNPTYLNCDTSNLSNIVGVSIPGPLWTLSNPPASAFWVSARTRAQLYVNGKCLLSLWLARHDLASHLFSEVLIFGGCCQVEGHSLADLTVASGEQ